MGWRSRSGVLAALALVATTAAVRAEDDADCLARFAARTVALDQLESDFVRRVYARTLFVTGKANPTAARALGPLLEQAMQLAAPEPPAVALECRTWACRIRVLHGARIDPAAWEKALRAPGLLGRLHSIAVVGRRPTTDALDGEDLVEATVYFKLVDPSGERVASRSGRLVGVEAAKCAATLAAVEKRMAAMKAIIDRDASPSQRFARAPANPALTAELEARLRQAKVGLPAPLAAPFARLAVECHGVICQVQPAAGVKLGADEWRQLERRPPLADVIVGRAYEAAAYWLVRPPQTADGRAIVERLVAEVEAGPLLESCHKQHPAAGHLLVSYVLAGRDPLGRAAKKGGLSVICTGSLAETPLGRCVAEELGRTMASAALPAEVLNWTKNRRYDWTVDKDTASIRAR
jgi:phage tail protein X